MGRKLEVAKSPVETWGCVSLFEVKDVASGLVVGRRANVRLEWVAPRTEAVTVEVVKLKQTLSPEGGLAATLGNLVAAQAIVVAKGSLPYEDHFITHQAYNEAIASLTEALVAQQRNAARGGIAGH